MKDEHYRPFWEQGIAVDVIDADGDLTPYQLVIAPMHMVRALPAGGSVCRQRRPW
jgi:beta-galactosidase